MNRDHNGNVYSVYTDDEERFDTIIRTIKYARSSGDFELEDQYARLLQEEFGDTKLGS